MQQRLDRPDAGTDDTVIVVDERGGGGDGGTHVDEVVDTRQRHLGDVDDRGAAQAQSCAARKPWMRL